MLRDLIARGVDEAALLNGPAFAGADTLATARALAAAARVLGPFDLLLYLVSRQKVDIGAISITEIADQYLAEVSRMETLDLDVASDFLLVAGPPACRPDPVRMVVFPAAGEFARTKSGAQRFHSASAARGHWSGLLALRARGIAYARYPSARTGQRRAANEVDRAGTDG